MEEDTGKKCNLGFVVGLEGCAWSHRGGRLGQHVSGMSAIIAAPQKEGQGAPPPQPILHHPLSTTFLQASAHRAT